MCATAVWKYGCKVGRNIWEVVDRGHTAAGAGPSQRGSTPIRRKKAGFQCSAQALQEKPDYQGGHCVGSLHLSRGVDCSGNIPAGGAHDHLQEAPVPCRGIEKLEAGDYAGAIGSFDTALEKSGKGAEDFNRDVLLYRADAEFLLKDYNAAIHTYDLLLEMKPDTPEYMYRQSSCYARLGDTDNALERYQEAKALDKKDKPVPGRQEALLAAGSACVDAKEYDKAMALYEDALKDGMEHGEIYNQMGLCQMAAEDYQSAYDSFDKGYQVAAAAQAAALQEKDRKTGKETEQKETKDGDAGEGAGGENAPAVAAEADGFRELLKELSYNRAAACEHLQQYDKALALFEDFVKEFGSNEDAEHEIAFLKTR